MLSGFTPRPLKRLFTANQCWTSFLDAGGLRDIEVEAVTKMLACGTRILGVKEFESNRWLLNDVCRLAVENLLYAA
ncbi:transposase [Escherichia coli T426]|nr:transposase [Escherichia coli T426]